MYLDNQKMEPLLPDHWPEELSEIRSFLRVPLNIHNIMAHHPDLMKAWSPFRNHVVADSSLSPRQRELLILRTAFNCQTEYEWKHHVARGLKAGLDATEIERVKQGSLAAGWNADEAALLSAADDCQPRSLNLLAATFIRARRCQAFGELGSKKPPICSIASRASCVLLCSAYSGCSTISRMYSFASSRITLSG